MLIVLTNKTKKFKAFKRIKLKFKIISLSDKEFLNFVIGLAKRWSMPSFIKIRFKLCLKKNITRVDGQAQQEMQGSLVLPTNPKTIFSLNSIKGSQDWFKYLLCLNTLQSEKQISRIVQISSGRCSSLV